MNRSSAIWDIMFRCAIQAGPYRNATGISEILSEKQTDGIVLIGSVFNELINYPEITAKIKRYARSHCQRTGKSCLIFIQSWWMTQRQSAWLRIICLTMGVWICSMFLTLPRTAAGQNGRGFLEAMKLRDVPDGNDRVVIVDESSLEGEGMPPERFLPPAGLSTGWCAARTSRPSDS